MEKKNEQLEDLAVGTEQAAEVKGGIIDPNNRTFVDPNVKSVIDPNNRTWIFC